MTQRYCKSCKKRHEPPTGKDCLARSEPNTDSSSDALQQVLQELSNITTRLNKLEQNNGGQSTSQPDPTPADTAGSALNWMHAL